MYRKRSRLRPWVLALILLILVAATTGTAAAKYVYRQEMEGKVTFTAQLAEDLLLQEHEAVRKNDGSYELEDKLVTSNTYKLLPGLDIPKDPQVTVVNKTPLRAYLYIEVVSSVNGAITYEIDKNNWEELTDVTGPHGGTVYAYKSADPLTNENCPTAPINTLATPEGASDQIKVSQKLLSQDTNAEDILSFYAYLYEVYDTETGPASKLDVFRANNPAE